jgi:hypothetical protein
MAPTCPHVGVKGQDTTLLLVDPVYYQFEGCKCLAGYAAAVTEANSTAVAVVCEKHAEPKVGSS